MLGLKLNRLSKLLAVFLLTFGEDVLSILDRFIQIMNDRHRLDKLLLNSRAGNASPFNQILKL
ncbi:hypothetical protein [Bradyrhizobium sp. 131]|uniref:hypothetical protein n=1 Tax=Bradyrhizobium sp. 131 TaxID=2782609 RepID=UPI0031F7B102